MVTFRPETGYAGEAIIDCRIKYLARLISESARITLSAELEPPVAENDTLEGGTPGDPITVPDITDNDTPGNCDPVLTETIVLFSPDGTDSGEEIHVEGEGTRSEERRVGKELKYRVILL